MFSNLNVRSKLLTIVAAVVVLFTATVLVLGQVAKRHVVASVQTEMERSSKVVTEYFNSRYRQLDAGLNSLVDSPEIRAVLTTEGIDHATQLMSITDLQHVLGADAILYCNEAGRTLARTDDPFDEESMVDSIPVIASALTGKASQGFWDLEGESLLAIAFPVTIDDEIMGVVCAGIDVSGDAGAIKSLLLRDLIVCRGGRVLTQSLTDDGILTNSDLVSQPVSSVTNMADVRKLPAINVAGTEVQSRVDALAATVLVTPSEGEKLHASVIIPASSIYGFYHDFQRVLLILGLTTIGVSVLITFRIASMISDQVRRTLNTLEQVAAGDLTTRLQINSKDEFGRIADALNTAITASARTLDTLAVRNRDTKMLLDAVEQGFFTVDSDGVMSEERSGAVDRMFGAPGTGMTFADFVAKFDPRAAEWIEIGMDDVFMEIMPVEVTLDQMPKRFEANQRTYAIEYTPVRIDDQLVKIAVVLSDITALVANEKLESAQREMMAMVHRMADDRSGFLEFFEESDDLVSALQNESHDDLVLVKRRVHTLKGNAAIYGLVRVSQCCHVIEDFIAENNELPESAAWTSMFQAWDSVRDNLARIRGEHQKGIEVADDDFDQLLDQVLNETPYSDLAVGIASWRLEPTAIRIARVCEQVRVIGKRLGKGEIDVRQQHGDLRLDPSHWSEFWSSFIHVVRNAVDHGLETPEERLAKGKPEPGRIDVGTAICDRQFVITLRDDGKGIDWMKVTEAAYSKGLPAETHDDLVDALFADGVSTAQQVTETSGRGVGMSAVKESCLKLGGRISIESQIDQGTTIRFAFPIKSMAPETMGLLNGSHVDDPERVLGASTASTPSLINA